MSNDAVVLPGLTAADPAMLEEFTTAFAAQQQATRRLWEATVAAWHSTRAPDRDFVDDELALIMNVHPATAEKLLIDACQAHALPALIHAWTARQLTDRHVRAAVEQLHSCLPDHDQQVAVLDRVLDRCRRRARDGHDWPTPGELRRLIRAAALLLDPAGAAERKEQATASRGVHACGLPDGQAMLALDGPEEQVLMMLETIRAHAAMPGREPGDDRTREQREFDAAYELLTASRPASGPVHPDPAGNAVHLQAQVVVPIDTAEGADTTLGELPGLGPILPSTCRELLSRADTLRRICLDAHTGQVLAVDDPISVHGDPDAIKATLAAMRTDPVELPDLSTSRYRPTAKAVRFVQTRDRTCRFPGCTRPATRSDLDHRLPWPLGPTNPANLHALCRHHHRAKQSNLFTVTTDPDGSTAWTLIRTGAVYRRPPPTLTHTW